MAFPIPTYMTQAAAWRLVPFLGGVAAAPGYILRALASYEPDDAWRESVFMHNPAIESLGAGDSSSQRRQRRRAEVLEGEFTALSPEDTWSYERPPWFVHPPRASTTFFLSSGMAEAHAAHSSDAWELVLRCCNPWAVVFFSRRLAAVDAARLLRMKLLGASVRDQVAPSLVVHRILRWRDEIVTALGGHEMPDDCAAPLEPRILLGYGTDACDKLLRLELAQLMPRDDVTDLDRERCLLKLLYLAPSIGRASTPLLASTPPASGTRREVPCGRGCRGTKSHQLTALSRRAQCELLASAEFLSDMLLVRQLVSCVPLAVADEAVPEGLMMKRLWYLGQFDYDCYGPEEWRARMDALNAGDGAYRACLDTGVAPDPIFALAATTRFLMDEVQRTRPDFRLEPIAVAATTRRRLELCLALGMRVVGARWTILHLAAGSSSAEALEYALPLVRAAGALHTIDGVGRTALDVALQHANLEGLQLLLDAGLVSRCPWPQRSIDQLPLCTDRGVECIQLLVRRGVLSFAGPVDLPDGGRLWALQDLCRKGNFKVLFALFASCADSRKRDRRESELTDSPSTGNAAATTACRGGSAGHARRFVAPVDFNAVDSQGWTAFQRALVPRVGARRGGVWPFRRESVRSLEMLRVAVPEIDPAAGVPRDVLRAAILREAGWLRKGEKARRLALTQ